MWLLLFRTVSLRFVTLVCRHLKTRRSRVKHEFYRTSQRFHSVFGVRYWFYRSNLKYLVLRA